MKADKKNKGANIEGAIQPDANVNQPEVKEEETKTEEAVVLPIETKTEEHIALPVEEVAQVVRFDMSISQKDADGHESFRTSITFSLPKDKEYTPDYVVGTALDRLFSKMELAKTLRVKFLDSRLPLIMEVASEHLSINLGTIEQKFLTKLKVNNGERSKLLLADSIIAITNDMLKPVSIIRASHLRENLRIEATNRYQKDVHGKISAGGLHTMVSTNLATLTEKVNGQLVVEAQN